MFFFFCSNVMISICKNADLLFIYIYIIFDCFEKTKIRKKKLEFWVVEKRKETIKKRDVTESTTNKKNYYWERKIKINKKEYYYCIYIKHVQIKKIKINKIK